MPHGRPIVIAHRGASGYLPEHSMAAKVLAHGFGADYLEQDVILTKDDVPIVFHDLELEALTDVVNLYPDRARSDGHWYAIDFTLAELRTLSLNERVEPATGARAWPRRFAGRGLRFPIVTLDEELELVRALNAARGRDAGVYTEVKSPAWHRAQGKDPSRIVLDTLARHGYTERGDNVFLQCFDDLELQRIRSELGCDLKLIQLVGETRMPAAAAVWRQLRSPEGLRAVAGYADGIGPSIAMLVEFPGDGAAPLPSGLCAAAHALGLAVHPYTLRIDSLPGGATGIDEVHRALFGVVRVDGVFTDFPDLTVAYLQAQNLAEQAQ